MRISDWSSDVCSSDVGFDDIEPGPLHRLVERDLLGDHRFALGHHAGIDAPEDVEHPLHRVFGRWSPANLAAAGDHLLLVALQEIGRAHDCTPVTNAQLVYRLLIEKQKSKHKN